MEKNSLIEEIKTLVILIENYKNEVAELDIQKEGFEAVKNHLKLAVEESKTAVEELIDNINKVIDNLEKILEIGKKLENNADKEIIEEHKKLVTDSLNILTNSITLLEFQDILTQRIEKVMAFLQEVEKKILRILLLVGISEEENKDKKREYKEKLEKLEWKKEVSQDDVDDILKEFGL